MSLYIPYKKADYLKVADNFPDYPNYTAYNYLNGISSFAKIRHFEVALQLAKKGFGKSTVIDFGTADGPLIPSLSTHFEKVYAVDANTDAISINKALCSSLGFQNVRHVLLPIDHFDKIFESIPAHKADYVFLLETLEHIGTKEEYYQSKIEFLQNIFKLLKADGEVIVSVPKMTGPPFLVQRLALNLLGLQKEAMTFKQILKAVFLNDVRELEKHWVSISHLGFNHHLLEKEMRNKFVITKKRDLFFQAIYSIKNR